MLLIYFLLVIFPLGSNPSIFQESLIQLNPPTATPANKTTLTPTISSKAEQKTQERTTPKRIVTLPITPSAQKIIQGKPYSIKIIKPQNGETFTKGTTITVEAEVTGKDKITKVDIATGYPDNMIVDKTLTSEPYSMQVRIPDYPYEKNKYSVSVWAYDKEGKYESDQIIINTVNNNLQVRFTTPKNNQEFTNDQTITLTAETTGEEPTKVEFYIGAGQLYKTLTSKPYTVSINLAETHSGIPSRWVFPLGLRAYDKNGNYATDSIGIYITPK